MAPNFDAIPAVQPALPSETSHGRHGSAHDTKHIATYQQASAHSHARETQRTTAAAQVTLSHADKTDKDGKGHSQDSLEHDSPQDPEAANRSQQETGAPAAIVSISPAARAAIIH